MCFPFRSSSSSSGNSAVRSGFANEEETCVSGEHSLWGEDAYDVAGSPIHENVDGYSIRVAHERDFDILAIEDCSNFLFGMGHLG